MRKVLLSAHTITHPGASSHATMVLMRLSWAHGKHNVSVSVTPDCSGRWIGYRKLGPGKFCVAPCKKSPMVRTNTRSHVTSTFTIIAVVTCVGHAGQEYKMPATIDDVTALDVVSEALGQIGFGQK